MEARDVLGAIVTLAVLAAGLQLVFVDESAPHSVSAHVLGTLAILSAMALIMLLRSAP